MAVSVAGTGSRVWPDLIWNISVGLLEALVGPAFSNGWHETLFGSGGWALLKEIGSKTLK